MDFRRMIRVTAGPDRIVVRYPLFIQDPRHGRILEARYVSPNFGSPFDLARRPALFENSHGAGFLITVGLLLGPCSDFLAQGQI